LLDSWPSSYLGAKRLKEAQVLERIHAQVYNFGPDGDHSTGDIWRDLPTHGLLQGAHASGLIVTPACDLSNRKVETITYLPIVSIRQWLVSPAFAAEVAGSIGSQLKDVASHLPSNGLGRYPTAAEVQALKAAVQSLSDEQKKPSAKLIPRALAGLRVLESATGLTAELPDPAVYLECLGAKKWDDIREGIVKNSLRSDVHFLPADRQDSAWSAVPNHSLVLFRYPMTAPIEIFDLAQDLQITDWSAAITALVGQHPIAASFAKVRPLKSLRIQNAFLGDLLSRYLALYLRMGAPDFSKETVAAYANELGR